jgi:hypothetical protein
MYKNQGTGTINQLARASQFLAVGYRTRMLSPQIVVRLRGLYQLAVGGYVIVPDGRRGRLMNVRFSPDIGVVQFLGEDGVYYPERFLLCRLLPAPGSS